VCFQVTLKVAYALAAGCTVVLKPSEYAPLSAAIFAEAVHAAGFPRGVFNMVHGSGAVAGAALLIHPQVDMVSFTVLTSLTCILFYLHSAPPTNVSHPQVDMVSFTVSLTGMLFYLRRL